MVSLALALGARAAEPAEDGLPDALPDAADDADEDALPLQREVRARCGPAIGLRSCCRRSGATRSAKPIAVKVESVSLFF